MAGEKKWSVYGVVIAALFWLAWVAFCWIALVTDQPYALSGGEAITQLSLFRGWNYLLAVCIRRRSVKGLVVLALLAVFGWFYVTVMSNVRISYRNDICRTEMRGVRTMATLMKVRSWDDNAFILKEYREDCRCWMRWKPDAEGRLAYHVCVKLPQKGAEERFIVVSHVLLSESAAAENEMWCSYETWKENVDAVIYAGKHGRPYFQDSTVFVFYTRKGGAEDRFPLSAAGFAACVDGAADADALYTAIKTTSEAETAAYERHMAICEYSRLGSAGATYFFMLLIMMRMVWRRRTYQPQA